MARSMPKDISFPVPVEVEKQITECDDPVVLASWLSRATTVSEVAESVAAKMPWFVVNDENHRWGTWLVITLRTSWSLPPPALSFHCNASAVIPSSGDWNLRTPLIS